MSLWGSMMVTYKNWAKKPERYGLARYSPVTNIEQGWRIGWVPFELLKRGQTTLIQMNIET